MQKPAIAIETCERLINGVVSKCTTPPPAPVPAPTNPNFDALAAAIASQGNAIASQANYLTIWTIALGIVAILATLGWGWLVKIWAEKAAKEAVTEWMDRNAPNEIAKFVADIVPNWVDADAPVSQPERRPLSHKEQEVGLGGDPAKDPA